MRTSPLRSLAGLATALSFCTLVVACVTQSPERLALHGWWSGLGPVVPHESFPAECSLCHLGQSWSELAPDFEFDHGAQTGVVLEGAHAEARCLRCHNDIGPVAVFAAQGCGGCHEDVHRGQLGSECTDCHDQETWRPDGQVAGHLHTRFPLVGVHTMVSCRECHPGAETGYFLPADTECLSCHRDELARTDDPPHVPLGWVDRCERCHVPTSWHEAQVDE